MSPSLRLPGSFNAGPWDLKKRVERHRYHALRDMAVGVEGGSGQRLHEVLAKRFAAGAVGWPGRTAWFRPSLLLVVGARFTRHFETRATDLPTDRLLQDLPQRDRSMRNRKGRRCPRLTCSAGRRVVRLLAIPRA